MREPMFRNPLVVSLSMIALLVWAVTGCEDPEDSPAPPEAPSAPTVTSGDSELVVSWTAVPSAGRYEVYFGTDDDSAAATLFDGDSDPADTSCVITGLDNGTLYYVWIKAVNSHGASDFSPSASGTPSETDGVPEAPSVPTVTPGNGELSISWDPVADATTYEVYFGTAEDSAAATLFNGDSDAADTSCVITGLDNGTLYYVWIKAVNAAGASDFSPSASGTPVEPIEVPDPLEAPTLTPGDEELTASWEPVAGATSYEIHYSTESSSSTATQVTDDSDDTDTTCIVTGLENGTVYFVWVKAVNSAGASDFSPSASVRVGTREMSVGSSTFMMVQVPGTTFPTAMYDDVPATVSDAYWIATTEVTYGLWYEVYTWAIDNGYTFENPGQEGHDGTSGEAPTDAENEPVTWVDWRSVFVWFNALTEYYNDRSGATLVCVYHDSGTPIRDATNYELCDTTEPDASAGGFRYPTGHEHELAARFIGDFNGDGDILDDGEYYPGSFVSGADISMGILNPTEDFDGDGDVDNDFAVTIFNGNSEGSTAEVGSLHPNALGLFDICGNVGEWCFDSSEPYEQTMGRGGSWADPPTRVFEHGFAYRSHTAVTLGFRVVMNAQ